MSELVLVFGVVALTIFVLLGLLFFFWKWLLLREQLMPQAEDATASTVSTRGAVATGGGARPSIQERPRAVAA